MFDQFVDGYCPQCLLIDEKNEMLLNHADFWECPTCHLQGSSASGGMFALKRRRGTGDFYDPPDSDKATRYVDGHVLAKVLNENSCSTECQSLDSEEALREFLATVSEEKAG